LHGAESDIVWLQENFNLYIVNLFDTFHASRALDLPRHSLAFLLSVYCDFTADKRYQLADWRIRPLPSEMLHYARSDTHFLLFIYDQLREALIERSKTPDPSTSGPVDGPRAIPSFIQTVLKNSAETSLREFVREQYDEEKGEGIRGWAGLARKWNKRSLLVDGPQRRVFLAVHKWRDRVRILTPFDTYLRIPGRKG
jgi:exosome complex exonuclease RRP6